MESHTLRGSTFWATSYWPPRLRLFLLPSTYSSSPILPSTPMATASSRLRSHFLHGRCSAGSAAQADTVAEASRPLPWNQICRRKPALLQRGDIVRATIGQL